MIYAGIGSRKTPKEVLLRMKYCAQWFGRHGFVLRSGGAEGADSAFELGCDDVGGTKEIYLPWPRFNGSKDEYVPIPEKAFEIAERFHPAWNRLAPSVKKLMARNTMQMLGADCATPADFVLCWTTKSGGTQQALRIAQDRAIPVFNMIEEGWNIRLRRFLGMPTNDVSDESEMPSASMGMA